MKTPFTAASAGGVHRVPACALALVLLALACWHAWRRPANNWDLLAYLGNSVRLSESNPARVHAQAYALARAGMPKAAYDDLLVSDDGFRQAVAADSGSFRELLAFYRPRILYIGLIAVGWRCGLEPVSLAAGISSLAIFGSSLLLWLWFSRRFGVFTAALTLPPLFCAFGFYQLAKLATPDALALLFQLAGAYVAIEYGRLRGALFWWALAIGTRSDCALFVSAFFAVNFMLAGPWKAAGRGLSLAGVAAPIAVAELLNHVTGNPGWKVLFHHCFLGQLRHPLSQSAEVSFAAYRHVLTRGVETFWTMPGYALAVAFIAFSVGTQGSLARLRENRAGTAALIALLASAGRFVLFPATDLRYVMPTLAIGLSASLISLDPRQNPNDPPS